MPKVFVSGHRGMVGSALVRALGSQSSTHELILASRDELDLLSQSEVEYFIKNKKPILLLMRRQRLEEFMPMILIRLNSFIKTC